MYVIVEKIDIHWCTISTPHPQWSSGYDFRVSIYFTLEFINIH
jgi:hypothetical protein